MQTKKKVLIICYSDHMVTPRVIMCCNALRGSFDLTSAGFAPVGIDGIRFIRLSGKAVKPVFVFHLNWPYIIRWPFSLINRSFDLLSGKRINFKCEDYRLLGKEKHDLVICHHPDSLELGYKLSTKYNAGLIFNAHEIYPYEFEECKEWMKLNYLPRHLILKRYLKKCNVLFSVNEEICAFYEKEYGVRSIAIHNSKPLFNLKPGEVKFPIQLIHHGKAMARRKLEQMADTVLSLNGKYELTFMLMEGENQYYLDQLRKEYEPKGIRFISPVGYHQIIGKLNCYDAGFYILPNENINQKLALPNKLFEFIQARLAVITSPNPAMKNLIEGYGIGAVSDDFSVSAMVKLLNNLGPEDFRRYKENCSLAARELSSERDEKRMLDVVREVLISEEN